MRIFSPPVKSRFLNRKRFMFHSSKLNARDLRKKRNVYSSAKTKYLMITSASLRKTFPIAQKMNMTLRFIDSDEHCVVWEHIFLATAFFYASHQKFLARRDHESNLHYAR